MTTVKWMVGDRLPDECARCGKRLVEWTHLEAIQACAGKRGFVVIHCAGPIWHVRPRRKDFL